MLDKRATSEPHYAAHVLLPRGALLTHATRLHPGGGVDCVAKETVARHLETHYASHTRTYHQQTVHIEEVLKCTQDTHREARQTDRHTERQHLSAFRCAAEAAGRAGGEL